MNKPIWLDLANVCQLAHHLSWREWRIDSIQNHTSDEKEPHRFALAATWHGKTMIFTHEVTSDRIRQLEDENW